MKILRTIYTLCAAALLFSSCQDEEMIKQSSVKEGIPVTIDLTFSAVVPKQEAVGTRAERNPENNVVPVVDSIQAIIDILTYFQL